MCPESISHQSFVRLFVRSFFTCIRKAIKGEGKRKMMTITEQKQSTEFIFHFHSYELLIVTTLGATLSFSLLYSIVVLSFDVMPISESMRSNHNTSLHPYDGQTKDAGMSVSFAFIFFLLSFNIDSLSYSHRHSTLEDSFVIILIKKILLLFLNR